MDLVKNRRGVLDALPFSLVDGRAHGHGRRE
jgi:hypothetical protein